MTTPPPVLAKLLSSSTRREILRIASAGEPISPTEMADRMGENLSNVTYHVRVLVRDNGLKLDHATELRGSLKHFYAPGPLVQAYPEYVNAVLDADDDPA